MKEEWKRLIYQGKDLGDFYEVSNFGEIRNSRNKKVRKKNILKTGYYFVSISLGSRKDKPTIKNHKAVAETFIENKNNHPIINHKDGNKLNNNINNLEWCSYQFNIVHAVENNLMVPKSGLENKNFKLNREEVDYIVNNYKPYDKIFGSRALGRKFNINHGSILNIINLYSK